MQQADNDKNVRQRDRRSPLRHRHKRQPVPADTSQLGGQAVPAESGNRVIVSPKGGAYWNIQTSTGAIVAKWFPKRPSYDNGLLKQGQRCLTTGERGYATRSDAITRERSDTWYPYLLRQAMERGILDSWGKRIKPTLADVVEWTGLSIHTLKANLKPITVKSHRTMHRSTIRLILHEFALRDHSTYNWKSKLKHCR